MALYDIEFIKEMTGITDTDAATFYTDAVIKKIERMIGYPLGSTEQTDYINGLGTSYIWLPRKPVTAISLVFCSLNSASSDVPLSEVIRKEIVILSYALPKSYHRGRPLLSFVSFISRVKRVSTLSYTLQVIPPNIMLKPHLL